MHKKVLIVDDEYDIRYCVKLSLEDLKEDIEVIGIESGEKCIEYLQNNNPPDLILLDIMMPKMDGWEVASKIKKNPSWASIPLFFVTAKKDAYSQSFGNIVSDDYISKPFELTELQERVKKALR